MSDFLESFGALTMFSGSILYTMFLFETNSALQMFIIPFVVAISSIIVQISLFFDFKFDDRLSKALGISLYFIGTAYQIRSAFVDVPGRLSYLSCILGWMLMIPAISLVYHKKGKPTASNVIFFICLGGLICTIGFVTFMLPKLSKPWATYLRNDILMEPKHFEKAWTYFNIGLIYLMNGVQIQKITMLKEKEGGKEPDVVFFGPKNIFHRIFH